MCAIAHEHYFIKDGVKMVHDRPSENISQSIRLGYVEINSEVRSEPSQN